MSRRVLRPGSVLIEGKGETGILEPEISLLPSEERRGKYVAIEGIDGSGKTTLTQLICEEMRREGKECDIVREPYYDEVKSLLHRMPGMNPIAEAYLFAADRMIMHSERLAPLLRKEGVLVLGDRSYLASIVYQSTRGAPVEVIMSLNSFAIQPDLVILLDLEPSLAWERLQRKGDRQLKHLEDRKSFERLRRAYLEISKALANPPVEVIDASPPPQEVLRSALEVLRARKII